MAIIDAHCHIWNLSRGDYDWLDVNNPALAAIAQNFSIADYEAAAAKVMPNHIVLVQAAATEAETEFLLAQAEKYFVIGAVVGWIDCEQADSPARIERFASNAYFRGIRPMLQDIADTDWLLHQPNEAIWQTLQSHQLSLDALVTPRHLPMLLTFAQQHPDLNIVIDHAAKPQWATERFDVEHYKTQMAALAKQSNVYCKISGLVTELAKPQIPHAENTLKPLFAHLLDCFGVDRLMWGSDWPVVNLAMPYAHWQLITEALMAELNQQQQHAILYATAKTFYRISGGEHEVTH